MKRNLIFRLVLMSLMLFSVFAGRAAVNDADTVRVLWIGNSYTFFNDLPTMVKNIAETNGVKMACTEVLKGGERLKGHHIISTQISTPDSLPQKRNIFSK